MEADRLYRVGSVQGASPAALVARLYEQIIEDLRQAVKALQQNQIESRTNKINHAILVLGHLHSQLDFAAGGKVAEDLGNFYGTLRANLIQAQVEQSEVILRSQITDLLTVREAWVEVERAEGSRLCAPRLDAANAAVSESGAARVDWKV